MSLVHLAVLSTLVCSWALKIDNGPEHTSDICQIFYKTFYVSLTMGMPYNPQHLEIVKHAHHKLKIILKKQKEESFLTKFTPHDRLHLEVCAIKSILLGMGLQK